MSVYIHIPFCLRKCFYCVFPVHIIGQSETNQLHFKNQIQQQYVNYLIKDIQTQYKGEKLKTLYFGGGTPSLLSPHSLNLILKCFNYNSETEVTIEADPKTFNADKLKALKELGFNRLSIGIQSLQDDTLRGLNRSHNKQDVDAALNDVIKIYGSFDQTSFDLLYNLPDSPTISQGKQLEDISMVAKQLKPGHLSLYSLQIEEGSYYYEKLNFREEQYPLPNNTVQAENFIKVHQLLDNYDHYEISNFALSDKQISRHNMNYWLGNSDFYGFGMGATSLHNLVRTTRPKTVKQYFNYVDTGIGSLQEDESSDFEKQRILLMSRLRTKWGIEKSQLSANVLKAMNKFAEYLIFDEKYVRLKIPEGYLVCDEIVGYLQNIK